LPLLKFQPSYIYTQGRETLVKFGISVLCRNALTTDPVGLLWRSDQLVAEAATYTPHNTRDEHPYRQQDSKQRSQ